MSEKTKDQTKRVVRPVRRKAKGVAIRTARVTKKLATSTVVTAKKLPSTKTYQNTKRAVKKTAHHSKRVAKFAHKHIAKKPHEKLMSKSKRYAWWHSWSYKKFNHKHVHYAALGAYLLIVGVIVLHSFGVVFAAEVIDSWNFSNPSDYTVDSAVEVNDAQARLKGQSYASDGNTAALYHMDEGTGTTLHDTSSNGNDATATGSPGFAPSNLGQALSLNGTNQSASAPDSPSLSMAGQQSLEAWIKPNQQFDGNSNSSQTILDKGSYKLGLDRTSGKAFYEVQDDNPQWTKRLGDGLAGGWSFGHETTESIINYGSDIYVGLGNTNRGSAEVWRWDGIKWQMIGGDGIKNSWADMTYEAVETLAVNGNALYVGLGRTAGNGEIWTCDIPSGCQAWTKIGGDGLGIAFDVSYVGSMAVHGGQLYAGTGGRGGFGDVYRYNGGTSWTQVGGGAGLNNGWVDSAYESVASLYSDGSYLYAGLGLSAGDAEVWRYDGSSWTKIGGDGLYNSWTTNFETVRALISLNGKLYAGLGDSGNDAKVYFWDGTTWTDTNIDITSSYTQIQSFATDGTYIFASRNGQTSTYTGSVLRWNGSNWTKVAGYNTNSSWMYSGNVKIIWANAKLYALAGTSYDGQYAMVWQWPGSGNWQQIGGSNLNESWESSGYTGIYSSATLNGKLYFGLGGSTNAAQVYEYDGVTTRRIGGSGLDGSWPINIYEYVESMVAYKGSLYVGLGFNSGDGVVWKWDGNSWTQIGGGSVNGTWGASAYGIAAMTVWKNKLYIGQGVSGGTNNEVWQFDDTTWTKVGGSWSPGFRWIYNFAVYDDKLCVAGGGQVSNAMVYCWSGSGNWQQIGGNGLNNSWNINGSVITNIIVQNNHLIALCNSNNDLTIWKYDGSSWTQIGGSSLNGSWDSGYYPASAMRKYPMAIYNGDLYVGTGGYGDIWRLHNITWERIAGNGESNGWLSGTIEAIHTMVTYKGKLYVGLGDTPGFDAFVYSYGDNGYVESSTNSLDADWHHLAGIQDGSTLKLYIDGTQVGSSSKTISGVDNDLPLKIGNGYGSGEESVSSTGFDGQIDEVRISNTARSSFNSRPFASTSQTVSLANAIRTSGVKAWTSFNASETPNGGTITYQLSDDNGETWKYWNGTSWVTAQSLNQANTQADVDANIHDFSVTYNGIRWRAILKGDGNQLVTLNSVTLKSDPDTDPPGTNAHGINAYTDNGGTSISSNAWTNATKPYFSWQPATDSGSSIYGYCLYLGQTQSADPVSTKGLLGASPAQTGNHCQFITTETSLNLATAGFLGTDLSTSSSPYYLNIKAIDKAGNVFGDAEQFQFRFDNTPPNNPSFVSAPSEFVSNKTVTFTWPTVGNDAPSDNHSELAGLQYRIGNGGQWRGDGNGGSGLLSNDGSYTTRDNPDFLDINEGNNVFNFRAIDQAGNVSNGYVSATLRLNTSSPSSPQDLSVSPQTNTQNSFSFSWDAPSSFVGSASNLTYCYTVNTLPTENTCIYTSAGVTSLSAGAYATQPGQNTFYVVAKDNNINYATASSVTFTANTSAPGVPLDLDVADVSTKSTSTWRLALSWNPPTNTGAGVSSYRIYRSTNNINFFQVASTSGTSYVDASLAAVKYYYKVMACDSANNCGAFSQIVNKLPTGRFTSPAGMTAQPLVSDISTKKVTIRWSTDRDSDSKILLGTRSGTYQPYQIASADQVTDHKVELNNLTPGTTYFAKATWTDEDGNIGTSSEFTFKTEPAPSTQEVITKHIGLSSAQIQFTSVSAAKVTLQYGKNDSFGGTNSTDTSLSKSTYTVELTGLDDGTKYFYRLNTFDSDGNEYEGSTVLTFTTPARPRISNLRFQPVEGEPTSTQKITWDTNVPASSLIRFESKGLPAREISSSKLVSQHEIVVRDLLDDTQYSLVAESRDAGGNLAVSDAQTLKTALDTRPPKVSDIKVETSIRGVGAEARGQIVVSWKTDEPATSQVAYDEGSRTKILNNKSSEDSALVIDHIVIVSDLPTSRVFSVQPISKDKSSNSGSGETKSAIIERASDSVLTIMLNTLKKVFGF